MEGCDEMGLSFFDSWLIQKSVEQGVLDAERSKISTYHNQEPVKFKFSAAATKQLGEKFADIAIQGGYKTCEIYGEGEDKVLDYALEHVRKSIREGSPNKDAHLEAERILLRKQRQQ